MPRLVLERKESATAVTLLGTAIHMRSLGRWCRNQSAALFCVLSIALGGSALAQVPIPVNEQVRFFNSLPASQRQALIRELQSQLPPAQREAIIRALQGGVAMEELDSAAQAALSDALSARVPSPGEREAEDEESKL